ncbi:MAG: class I SAM-dependent methyltransferase [Acidobacteria bacterium]|nr:class I SAM-dependent methyltransferase [Acidobacteriota bacterium]
MVDLQQLLGGIDIYLLDQVLRGRIRPGMRILDAGCGGGRNLVYFLREGYAVRAADQDAEAVQAVRELAGKLAPELPPENFRAEPAEAMSFPRASADVVISSAVLHFARDDEHFRAMLDGCWQALASGGLFFCRLASTIGMERRFRSLRGRWSAVPDGSERYLVDQDLLLEETRRLGGRLADPLKTTIVQDLRSMTTWVLWKD